MYSTLSVASKKLLYLLRSYYVLEQGRATHLVDILDTRLIRDDARGAHAKPAHLVRVMARARVRVETRVRVRVRARVVATYGSELGLGLAHVECSPT